MLLSYFSDGLCYVTYLSVFIGKHGQPKRPPGRTVRILNKVDHLFGSMKHHEDILYETLSYIH